MTNLKKSISKLIVLIDFLVLKSLLTIEEILIVGIKFLVIYLKGFSVTID